MTKLVPSNKMCLNSTHTLDFLVHEQSPISYHVFEVLPDTLPYHGLLRQLLLTTAQR